jgi:hypothetical protein
MQRAGPRPGIAYGDKDVAGRRIRLQRWGDFRREVAAIIRLLREAEGRFIIFQQRNKHRFVQFRVLDDGAIKGEAVSNNFLEKGERLTAATCRHLVELGWQKPARTSPNFWSLWTHPLPIGKMVSLAVTTLRDAFEVASPCDLEICCHSFNDAVPAQHQTGIRSTRDPDTTAHTKRSAARLERLVAELFRAHWRAVEADITNGVDVPRSRADYFYASARRQRLRLARRYYAPARAAKFANASVVEILHMSEPWLGAFRDQVEYWCHEGRALRKELRQLVAAEYVAVSWLSPDPFGRPRQELTSVSPHPDETVVYGDLYEVTASGFSCGSYLRICKSAAEPFRESERIEAMVGIKREFFDNAAENGEPKGAWQINFRESEDPRVIEADVEPGDA